MNYEEIANVMGISIARVQQIEKRALEKLRNGLAKQGVTLDDVRALALPPDNEFPMAAPSARQHRFESRTG